MVIINCDSLLISLVFWFTVTKMSEKNVRKIKKVEGFSFIETNEIFNKCVCVYNTCPVCFQSVVLTPFSVLVFSFRIRVWLFVCCFLIISLKFYYFTLIFDIIYPRIQLVVVLHKLLTSEHVNIEKDYT